MQIKRNEICSIKAIISENVKVEILINENEEQIVSSFCSICEEKGICGHSNCFMFWLHRKTSEPDVHGANVVFWENNHEETTVFKIRDLLKPDELRLQADQESENIRDEDSEEFLRAILDEMENSGITDSILYKHCRLVNDEFEPLYIHHTMLDNANNYVKDVKNFNLHMEEVFRSGLFEKVTDVTVDNYKKQIWYEVQFGRIRCSMIHRIALRKDTKDDEEILSSIFCSDRQWHAEDRCQLKEHKRFILKQTEKLEDKTYRYLFFLYFFILFKIYSITGNVESC